MNNTEILLLGLVVAVATGVISFNVGHSKGRGSSAGVVDVPTVRRPTIDPRRAGAALILSRQMDTPAPV